MASSTQALFAKAVPIILKQCPSAHFAEVKQSNATKTIADLASQRKNDVLVQVSLTTKQDGRVKVLEVQLTDEEDPYFLYQLQISDDAFHTIKQDQNLLVDFQQFPEKAIDLLQECIKCKNEEHPKFVAQLLADANAQNAIFNIIETNTFKHITHLSLRFTPGNDQSVKKYLATLVKHYKSDAATLRQELSSTSGTLGSRVSGLVTENGQLRAELDAAKLKNAEMVSDLKMNAAQQLASERERWNREKEDGSRGWENQRRDLTDNYDRMIRDLSSELHTLKQAHTTLTSHAQTTDSTLASTSAQLSALTDQYTALRRDYDQQNASFRSLESNRFSLEKDAETLRGKLMGLERVVQEKEEMIERMGELWREAKEGKEKVEENLVLYKQQSSRAEDNLKSTSEEIKKGNDIIGRLQAELRTLKSKLKVKNMVTIQQEKLVDERAETIETLQRDLESARRAEIDAVKEKDDERRKVDALKTKLEESKTIIEENANVIDWLHKQLNQEALLPSGGGGGGIASSSSSSQAHRYAATSKPTSFGQIDFDRYAGPTLNQISTTRSRPSNQHYTYSNSNTHTAATSTPLSATTSQHGSQIPRYDAAHYKSQPSASTAPGVKPSTTGAKTSHSHQLTAGSTTDNHHSDKNNNMHQDHYSDSNNNYGTSRTANGERLSALAGQGIKGRDTIGRVALRSEAGASPSRSANAHQRARLAGSTSAGFTSRPHADRAISQAV